MFLEVAYLTLAIVILSFDSALIIFKVIKYRE